VSRVGGSAQIPAMKKIAGSLRIELAQYRELAAFAQFGSDLDADTREKLAQGERLREILKQPRYRPVPVEYQVIILFAAVKKYLLDIEADQVGRFEAGLTEYIDARYPEIPKEIREKKQLDEELEGRLGAAVAQFKKLFQEAERNGKTDGFHERD
ncbi:MAG TPA: F0F1 ATP synthase subunit alpha, partial [Candidatus Caccomorpha excrementavium]|nr:F0F1 ATP synthase subunit alpha [Candidatus Caccomorpha excrementavium]